ncbi:MAG: metallophosphoesterase [Tissierellia bacterium]|nr:metallophosphoesterase [Tissierellia bacterium]
MKIFTTSDIHGNQIILEKLKELSFKETPDYILVCGDVGGKYFNVKSLIDFSNKQRNDLKHLQDISNECYSKSSLFYILGNDDWFESGDIYHLPYCRFKPEGFIPFEYVSITPFSTNREANENKIEYELSKLKDITHDTIIVAHDMPYQCLDKYEDGREVGSKSIRKFIKQKQPKIWLGGHIHESFGAKNIGNTYVFNCSCRHEYDELRGWMIDTETMNYEKILQ